MNRLKRTFAAVLISVIILGITALLPPAVQRVVVTASIMAFLASSISMLRFAGRGLPGTFKPDPVAVYDPDYVAEHKRLLDTLQICTRGGKVNCRDEWLWIICDTDCFVVTFASSSRHYRDEYQVPRTTARPVVARSYFYQDEWWYRLFGMTRVPREVVADLHRRIDAYEGASSGDFSRLLEEKP